MKIDTEKYKKVQYVENGRDVGKDGGLDCWGLVCNIYADNGIALPDFSQIDASDALAVSAQMDEAKANWQEVETPKAGDVVLLRIDGLVSHCGIMLSRYRFLHIRKTHGVVVERIDSSAWSKRVHGIYRRDTANNAIVIPRPLAQHRVNVAMKQGETLLDLHERIQKEAGYGIDAVVTVDGVQVPKDEWGLYRPNESQRVTYRAVLHGDGNNNQLLGTLLVVGAVFLGGALGAAYLAPALGWSALAGASAGYLLGGLAGFYLADRIFPIRPPKAPDSPESAESRNIYGSGPNGVSPYSAIPIVLGTHRMSGPFGQRPYVQFTGDRQVIRFIVIWGYGPLSVENLRIDNTPVSEIEGVETYTVYGLAGEADTDSKGKYVNRKDFEKFAGKAVEQIFVGEELNVGDDYIEKTFVADSDRIAFQFVFPQGLNALNTKDGKRSKLNCRLSIQYTAVGNSWTGVGEANTKVRGKAFYIPKAEVRILQDGPNGGQTITYTAHRRSIIALTTTGQLALYVGEAKYTPLQGPDVDPKIGKTDVVVYRLRQNGLSLSITEDNRAALGITGCDLSSAKNSAQNKITIANGVYPPPSPTTFNITANNKDTFTRVLEFDVEDGVTYKVRVKRIDLNSPGTHGDYEYLSTVVWHSVNSYSEDSPIRFPYPLAMTAVRIDGDKFQVGNSSLNAIVSTVAQDYLPADSNNDTGWREAITSNPAALLRYVRQGPFNARPDPDEKLDFESLEDFAEECQINGWEYNGIITNFTSLDSLTRDILASGRASPSYVDGKLFVIMDRPQSDVVQLITSSNSWGFAGNRNLPDLPHAFRVKFNNEEKDWQEDEVVIYNPGYDETNTTKIETINLPGQTNPYIIMRHVIFHRGQLILRPEKYSVMMDWEHIVMTRGDLVEVQPNWQVGDGRIVALEIVGSEPYPRKFTLDQLVALIAGVEYNIVVRNREGEIIRKTLEGVDRDGNYSVLYLRNGDYFDTTSGVTVGDLCIIGEKDEETFKAIVISIVPQNDGSANVTLVDYSPEIYDLDSNELPEFDSHVSGMTEWVSQSIRQVAEISSAYSGTAALYYANGAIKSAVILTIDTNSMANTTANSVEIRYGHVDSNDYADDWVKVGPFPIAGGKIRVDDMIDGDYLAFQARFVDTRGRRRQGPWGSSFMHSIIGKTQPPDDVPSYTLEIVGGKLRVTVPKNDAIDEFGMIVYVADSNGNPDVNNILYQGREYIADLDPPPPEQTLGFAIVYVDSSGNVSQNPLEAYYERAPLGQVSNVRSVVTGTSGKNSVATITWDAAITEFELDYYLVEYEGAMFQTKRYEVKTTALTIQLDFIGSKTFSIKTVDIAGGESDPVNFTVTDTLSHISTMAVAAVSSNLLCYLWNDGVGFGDAFDDPLSSVFGLSAAFSPSGNAVAIAHNTSPYVTAYPWSDSTGFGTKYSNPGTLPTGAGRSVAFSPSGNAIAVSHDTSPYITAYPWSDSTGFGTKYSDPGTLPAGEGYGVAFSPSGNAIAVVHEAHPYVTAYPWSDSTGFGTKYSDPGTLPIGTGRGVAFSPSGNAIAVAHDTSPLVTAYPWSDSTGFGTKYSDPGTLPTGGGYGVAFSPSGNAIAVAHEAHPYVTAYPWSDSTGFGTKYSDPGTPPAGGGYGVAFSPTGGAIAVAHITSPYVTAYTWSDSTGFGTKYSNPGTLPTGNGQGISFN